MREEDTILISILVILEHKISRIETRDIDNKQMKQDALKLVKELKERIVDDTRR